MEKSSVFTMNNFFPNFVKQLDEFRKDGILCDVILRVGESEFYAHKNVLAISSPFFFKLFTSDMKEHREKEVNIKNLDPTVMESLLDFIYTGEITITFENSKALVMAADYLLMTNLKTMACEYLETVLTPANCLSLRDFAEKYSCEELKYTTEYFILNNFVAVSKTTEFLSLSAEQVAEIITNEQLIVESEEQVYEAVLEWIDFDFEERKESFQDLFPLLRLSSMSKYYLEENVENNPLVSESLVCVRTLYEAMKTYAFPEKSSQATQGPPKNRSCLETHVEAVVAVWSPGDENRSSTLCYTPDNNCWFNLAPTLMPRFLHGVAACGEYVYTAGGISSGGHLSGVDRFDYKTNTWTSVAQMDKEISAPGVTSMRGYLYVVGGWNRGGPINSVSRYDPESNSWSAVSPMNTSRGGPCVVADRYLYSIGGKSYSSKENDLYIYLDTVERYCPVTDTWTHLASMKSNRAYASGVLISDRIYVVGGTQDDLQTSLSTCELYDIRMDQWTDIASTSRPRANAGIAYVNGALYVLGGKKSFRERSDTVEKYDFSKSVWEVIGSVPNTTGGLQCCTISLSKKVLDSLTKLT